MGNTSGATSAAGVCVLESAVNFDLAHFKLPKETIYGELTLFSKAIAHGELQLRFELDYLPARPIHIPIHADRIEDDPTIADVPVDKLPHCLQV